MNRTLTIVMLAGGILFFVVLVSRILRATGGSAPGWRVRCRRCGGTWPAADSGIVRRGAAGRSSTFLRCPSCEKVRWVVVEPEPEPRPRGHHEAVR